MHPDMKCFQSVIQNIQQLLRLRDLFLQITPDLNPENEPSQLNAPSLSRSGDTARPPTWSQISMSHKITSQINGVDLDACISLIQDVVELDLQDDEMLVK